MSAPGPTLTVHRSTNQIGGNCIELAFDGHRLLLDAGHPLDADEPGTGPLVPPTLDTGARVDALVISHPHQDHYGLLRELPPNWPVWCGEAAAILMRTTAAVGGGRIAQPLHPYRSGQRFEVGPFAITPFLTDHSAFDAHMVLVECAGRRLLYSGDFRRTGRKAKLVDRMMAAPPPDIDVLLLEGTTLGRTEAYPTESDLEARFATLFRETKGRVFVTWSAQNIDRTVTLYRACKRTGRPLVLDLYALDVLERLGALHDSLPRLGWPGVVGVVTSSMARMFEDPTRMNDPDFVTRCARSGRAVGAARLADMPDAVVMLRSSLLRDYRRKGLGLTADDAWVFSMWSGYLGKPEYVEVRRLFESAGAQVLKIHTSGHASVRDLQAFARRIAPRHLVPIHGATWDAHLDRFEHVLRLGDGEPFVVP
jgi:ribonuclease J